MISKLNFRSVVSRSLSLATAALVAASLLSGQVSHAAVLSLELHGALGDTSTFDGNPLGTLTQFEINGTFDTSVNINPFPSGQATYPFLSFSIELLNGPYAGTYSAPPAANLNAYFIDNVGYFPNISLADATSDPAWIVFATFTPSQDVLNMAPPFTYGAPYTSGAVQTTYNGFTGGYILNLTGHTLVLNKLGTDPSIEFPLADVTDFYGQVGEFAEISAPEPSTFVLSALGLAGLGLVGWKRRRSRG
ncbi:MAG: PEP-CTERM sorting domain-containing protein [Planctomycetia bacterium]|nr:PEP-CTERM sorting domain-containing protein [Planctomycetia bacterium]